jgi:ubiquinone/menaquinone biosynthesis C-methylase UbiE
MQDVCLFDVAGFGYGRDLKTACDGCFGNLELMATRTAANLITATREAYERWAPLYPPVAHNPLMRAEQRTMIQHWPELAGRRALDLACGTGRYSRLLAQANAGEVVAVDFCAPMLAQVSIARRVCASMMQLPFASGAFDVVISGLALGHATCVESWMTEIARVLSFGGTLLYSDFHPEAARVGLTRSFKDQNDRTCTVPHHCYDLPSQQAAANAASLTIDVIHELRVGVELREPFPKSEEFYRRWTGLPIVLVVRARK